MRTGSVRATLILVVLAALSACTVSVPGTPQAGVVERLGPKGPVPAGLERYYGQQLVWSSCKPFEYDAESRLTFGRRDTQCTWLEVPLDYAEPDGRTASIGLLRIPAGDRDRRIGALVINPGGPGASGMSAAGALGGGARGTELGDRFDFVGFDPRGVGVSRPRIECLTGPETDAERAEPPAATVEEQEAENQDFARKCTERTGADVLATVGTREVARDLDVLRSALGEEKLTYVGYSYGTRIGTAYAEAFPGNVRALVLDGAVDPTEDVVSQQINQAKAFQKAFDAFLDWCTDQDECALGSTQDEVSDELDALFDDVAASPLPVGDRVLSASDLATAVVASLYSEMTWPTLLDALDAARRDDGTALLELADTYSGRERDGTYVDGLGTLTAIRCMDDERITDRAARAEATRRITEAAGDTFLLKVEPAMAALDTCAFWPAPPTMTPHQPQTPGLPTVLVISTTGDPATPHAAGEQLAKVLDARLLTVDGVAHTAFLQGDRCVDDAGTAYLVNLVLPSPSTRC